MPIISVEPQPLSITRVLDMSNCQTLLQFMNY